MRRRLASTLRITSAIARIHKLNCVVNVRAATSLNRLIGTAHSQNLVILATKAGIVELLPPLALAGSRVSRNVVVLRRIFRRRG